VNRNRKGGGYDTALVIWTQGDFGSKRIEERAKIPIL